VWQTSSGDAVDAFQEWWTREDNPSRRLAEDAAATKLICRELIDKAVQAVEREIARMPERAAKLLKNTGTQRLAHGAEQSAERLSHDSAFRGEASAMFTLGVLMEARERPTKALGRYWKAAALDDEDATSASGAQTIASYQGSA
jgi:hypothetical protein